MSPTHRRYANVPAGVLVVAILVAAGGAYTVGDGNDERDIASAKRDAAAMVATARDLEAERVERRRLRVAIGLCEGLKADRVQNARAWRRAAAVGEARARDPGINLAERQRAAATADVYVEVAEAQRGRLFLCQPLIRDNERVADKRALRAVRRQAQRRTVVTP